MSPGADVGHLLEDDLGPCLEATTAAVIYIYKQQVHHADWGGDILYLHGPQAEQQFYGKKTCTVKALLSHRRRWKPKAMGY
jgi:hypothetical protein